ncbi:MAG: class I SAM-dependent methyltransferase [Candidatus Bathyarchaeia archaeon]
MEWRQYYEERRLSLDRYIGNIFDHRPFLTEIVTYAQKEKAMLEVGSGSGALSIFLSHLGFEIISIDNDPAVLDMANRNNKSLNGNVTFMEGNAFNVPFPDDRFDICFSQGFFEHFSDEKMRKLLKEQLRVSRVVIFSVPSFWYPRQDFGNERLIKKSDWLKILYEFKVAKTIYYIGKKGLKTRPSQIFFKVVK